MIDEPDLHIHISMVDQLLASLEAIVQQRQGQFIVASHSEQVWDWFSRGEEHIELGPWRKGRHEPTPEGGPNSANPSASHLARTLLCSKVNLIGTSIQSG